MTDCFRSSTTKAVVYSNTGTNYTDLHSAIAHYESKMNEVQVSLIYAVDYFPEFITSSNKRIYQVKNWKFVHFIIQFNTTFITGQLFKDNTGFPILFTAISANDQVIYSGKVSLKILKQDYTEVSLEAHNFGYYDGTKFRTRDNLITFGIGAVTFY